MKFGPCIEKNCFKCCDPVKVERLFPEEKIPRDAQGEKIWNNPRIIFPADNPDIKLKAYNCKKLDKRTGKCLDYGSRPDICKDTSCIDERSSASADDQYNATASKKFIEIKK